jgi:hypothetical protein
MSNNVPQPPPARLRHRLEPLAMIAVFDIAGVAVGTILGLISGNERLILAEGSVPTAIFGFACLGSLWASRPLIFRFALEFIGADSPQGRDFVAKWQYAGFRHVFRLLTVVWGARVSGWPRPSSAPSPARPRNCRMWPRNPPSRSGQTRCTPVAASR